MKTIRISCEGMGTISASLAGTFVERLAGLRWPTCGEALLIESASVHTIGLYPIGVIGIDRDSRVVGARRIAKNRVIWMRGANRILELPANRPLPPAGSIVEFADA